MSRMVTRNVFAREELHRERVYTVSGCAWCGSVKQTKNANRSFLFRYAVHTDSGRIFEDMNYFCCVDCRRAYYGA